MLPYTTKGHLSRGRPVHSVRGPPVSIINKCPMDMSTSQPAGGIASAEVLYSLVTLELTKTNQYLSVKGALELVYHLEWLRISSSIFNYQCFL